MMKMLHYMNILSHRNRTLLQRVGVFVVLLCCTLFVQAQIGGFDKPLKYSTHTYSVNMGNLSNTVTWDIYDSTATRERIDAKIDTAYTKTVSYRVNSETQESGVSYFNIEFSGTNPAKMQTGKKYLLVYKEQGSDLCYIYKFLPFELQIPFDVDVDTVANRCPDLEAQYREGTGTPTSTTTVEYHVILRNSQYITGGNWYFTVNISVAGQGGPSGTIDHVRYLAVDWSGVPPLSSTYTNNLIVPDYTKDVQFLITYNDVPGVQQLIEFNLDLIEGTYGDRDFDVINGTINGQNDIVHYINAMPGPSYIAARD
jgi:hypothetical protein